MTPPPIRQAGEPFKVIVDGPPNDPNWTVFNAAGQEIATCFSEKQSQWLCDRLNSHVAASGDARERHDSKFDAIDLLTMQSLDDWRRLGFSANDLLVLAKSQQQLLNAISEEGTLEINAAIDLRNKLASERALIRDIAEIANAAANKNGMDTVERLACLKKIWVLTEAARVTAKAGVVKNRHAPFSDGLERDDYSRAIEEDRRATAPAQADGFVTRGLDTDTRVRFYEHDFYVLSNFSAFRLLWRGRDFDTSEAAYHWERFAIGQEGNRSPAFGSMAADIADKVRFASSAHEAFKIAQEHKSLQRPDWDAVKVGIMRDILIAKANQHEYVRRKLLATGDRELVEDSWRDDFWGWGPNQDGQNQLGKLWMEVRAIIRRAEGRK